MGIPNVFASEMNKFLLVLAALLVAFVVSLPTETAHKKLVETPKHPDSIGEGAGTDWAVECKKDAYNTCTKCKAVAGNKCTWAWNAGTMRPLSGCGGTSTAGVSAHGTCSATPSTEQ